MTLSETDIRLRHFVDQMGVLFERSGGSVTMGRIIGHLLVCDPPAQSLAQIGEALQISKGSVSQLTRHLEQMGLIVRVPAPGSQRGSWYQARTGAWHEILREQIALTRLFVELADSGLQVLRREPEVRRDRLLDLRGFYVRMQAEMEEMVERYERDLRERTAAPARAGKKKKR